MRIAAPNDGSLVNSYSIEAFSPEQFANSGPNVTKREVTLPIGPNQLVWDLGVDNIYDDATVRERIKFIEEKFHLVMILENFEVSGTMDVVIVGGLVPCYSLKINERGLTEAC